MNILYSEHVDWTFPHWFDLVVSHQADDLTVIMDITQWCSDQCGEVGDRWGYERKSQVTPHPQGLNPVRIKLHHTNIHYSWRFKEKSDATMFKLRWGGR
jgi:hypothetical protein